MPGRLPHDGLAKAAAPALALLAGLALWVGCGDTRQGSGREEEPSEASVSAPTPAPDNRQAHPPRDAQGQASIERHEGLRVGEPAEFENGLVVTLESASLMPVPPPQLGAEEPVVAVHLDVKNANREDTGAVRSFNVTSALWQALNQDGYYLERIYFSKESLDVGDLPNPSSDEHPYLGWQGELRPGQERRGTVLFVVPPSTEGVRATFKQPVMSAPFAEWDLGAVSELPQAPS